MPRSSTLAALAALLISTGSRAEEPKPAAPVDPKVEALIREAVEKAKVDLRAELRQELQTAQATAEFAGASAPGPKFEFFEVDGYFRLRGDLKDRYDLHRGADNAGGQWTTAGGTPGNYIYPGPVQPADLNGAPNPQSTMTGANMRLRLLPTLNMSERVRVRFEVDLFDNYVLGSRPLDAGAAYSGAVLVDRPVINLKLAWGEVETPLGLISFGRMPSVWGLGIVAPAQDGLDDDFGNIVDRIQFATMPVSTVVGNIRLKSRGAVSVPEGSRLTLAQREYSSVMSCFIRCSWTARSLLAAISTPDVSLSRRCTIPGRSTPPMPERSRQ
jgi:hypothetical protein